MNYRVGQVLYVVLNKQTAVYPMQVVEEITKKTLNGVEVDYILRAGGPDSKNIRLNEVDGEIFDTADKARAVLTERVIISIHKRVDSAVLKAKEWYPESFETPSYTEEVSNLVKKPERVVASSQSNITTIDLGNGMVGRIKLPEGYAE